MKVLNSILFVCIIATACSSAGDNAAGQGAAVPTIYISDSPGLAPADIMEHIIFEAGGGAEGNTRCPCIVRAGQNLHLYGFLENHNYKLVAYQLSAISLNGFDTQQGFYLGHWNFISPATGALDLVIQGNLSNNLHFMAIDNQSGEIVSGGWLVFDAKGLQ